MNTHFENGQQIYFIEPHLNCVHPGHIVDNPDDGIYKVRDNDLGGVMCLRASDIFLFENDAKAELQNRIQKETDQLRDEIHSVEDLIQFLFDYQVTGEDADWTARTVAKEKAKELLGLEIQ